MNILSAISTTGSGNFPYPPLAAPPTDQYASYEGVGERFDSGLHGLAGWFSTSNLAAADWTIGIDQFSSRCDWKQ